MSATLDGSRVGSASSRSVALGLVTAYLILWVLEGALRRWAFPSLQAVFYVVRLPVAGGIIIAAVARFKLPWPTIPCLALIFSLILAVFSAAHIMSYDQSIPRALFGLRLYLEAPLVVLSAVTFMSRETLDRMMKLILLSTAPMAFLAIAQVNSPPTAFLNKQQSAGVDSIFINAGVVRATGTFTSPLAYSLYLVLCIGVLLAVLLDADVRRYGRGLFYVAAVSVALMSVTSGSRTVIFLGAVPVMAAIVVKTQRAGALPVGFLVRISMIAFVAFFAVGQVAPGVTEAFKSRILSANSSEDTTGRSLGTFTSFVPRLAAATAFGDGLGSHSLGQSNDPIENELERWAPELGYVLFPVLLVVRLLLCVGLILAARRLYKLSGSSRPVILAAAVLPTLLVGLATGQGSVVAFAAIGSVMTLAPVKTLQNRAEDQANV